MKQEAKAMRAEVNRKVARLHVLLAEIAELEIDIEQNQQEEERYW